MTKEPGYTIRAVARGLALAAVLLAGQLAAGDLRRVQILPPTTALPGTPGAFGAQVTVLPNGNVVVIDPGYSLVPPGPAEVGVVALYRPDGGLISLLRGTHAGDRVGDRGGQFDIALLANDNFVIVSSSWHDGRGAVTWGDAETGWGAGAIEVSADNSLVGPSPGCHVGGGGVTTLAGGHFVVTSSGWDDGTITDVGAVTWADGAGATVGVVSAQNSLVGSRAFDYVGARSVTALANGHYVVSSPLWDDGERPNVGAATWCSGTHGCVGTVGDNASLRGRQANDLVASQVVPLANGNYVVLSMAWQNDGLARVGAATLRTGSGADTDVVSPDNSLYGSAELDFQDASVLALGNGHWLLLAPGWDGHGSEDVGAIAWMHGELGGIGPVSVTNALTGARMGDGQLLWATELANGHYVAGFPYWDDGAIVDVGAVVWGDGTHGVSGQVETGNALVGSRAGDRAGWGGVVALGGGDYVVSSPWWDRVDEAGVRVDTGAATWRSGSESSPGRISVQNSLVGGSDGDFVREIIALDNGHYVVLAPSWDHGEIADVGAAIWCPASGCSGPILAEKALIGTDPGDAVGTGGFALADGNYVVLSWYWNQARGAVTWRPGHDSAPGEVTPGNSLVGMAAHDVLGLGDYGTFRDGSYLVRSYAWDVPHENAGAVVLARADGGTVGPIDLDRVDLVAGHGPHSSLTLQWHYGEDARLLAIGDPDANIVTLLQREMDRLFRDGFE